MNFSLTRCNNFFFSLLYLMNNKSIYFYRMVNKIVKSLKKINQRAWQRMLSGRRLQILNPSPLDIEIEDIAHGLSFLARWNGQTTGKHPFSVAQHSLLVEDIFSKQFPEMDNHSKLFGIPPGNRTRRP